MIPSNSTKIEIEEGYRLVYLGKEISNEFSEQITKEISVKKETNAD